MLIDAWYNYFMLAACKNLIDTAPSDYQRLLLASAAFFATLSGFVQHQP